MVDVKYKISPDNIEEKDGLPPAASIVIDTSVPATIVSTLFVEYTVAPAV